MTRSEFENQQLEHICPHCKSQGKWSISQAPEGSPHGEKVVCEACGIMLRWLTKEKNSDRRPRLRSGTIPEIWKTTKGYCACCGLHEDDLLFLGIGRTVQHVPPYDVSKDDGVLIPFCQWCQAQASGDMIRFRALVARLKTRDAH